MTENATVHSETPADTTTSAPADPPAAHDTGHNPGADLGSTSSSAGHGAGQTPTYGADLGTAPGLDHGAGQAPAYGADLGTAHGSADHGSVYGPVDHGTGHGATYGPGQDGTGGGKAALSEAFGKATRLFRRSRTDRMLGGVCGGAATALGVDATLLRVGLVAATVLGFGAGAVIYVVCWIVVPEAESDVPAV